MSSPTPSHLKSDHVIIISFANPVHEYDVQLIMIKFPRDYSFSLMPRAFNLAVEVSLFKANNDKEAHWKGTCQNMLCLK